MCHLQRVYFRWLSRESCRNWKGYSVMWSCNFPCFLLLQKYYYPYFQKPASLGFELCQQLADSSLTPRIVRFLQQEGEAACFTTMRCYGRLSSGAAGAVYGSTVYCKALTMDLSPGCGESLPAGTSVLYEISFFLYIQTK